MIYVILSSAFKDDNSFEKLIKIGYTDDSKKDRRYYQYKSHNPTIKILYEIPNGTVELEDSIHSYFEKYRYSNFGKEWFMWDEEIIQFFETYKTVEDLLTILDSDFIRRCPKQRFNGFVKFSYEVIDRCLNLKMRSCSDFTMDQALEYRKLCYEELDKSGLVIKDGVVKFILNYFDLTMDQYQDFIDYTKLPKNISEFIQEFNSLSGFHDKMRALCESSFNENEKIMILEQVPLLYKNMYLIFGPVRLKAKSYNITNLRRELLPVEEVVEVKTPLEIEQENRVRNKIYNTFEIGHRYLLSDIKNKLGDIYKDLDYKCSPKASDLEVYFDLGKIRFPKDLSGRRSPGYEILKKKA